MPTGGKEPRSHQPIAIGLGGAVAVLVLTATVALILPSQPGPAVADSASAALRLPHRPGAPFGGLGAWVDMYSWSATFSNGPPRFGPGDVDAMAAAGVETLYLQAASQTGPATVLEPDRLLPLVERAHRRGMSVVVWYLPRLVDLADDLTRLVAISHLPSEGLAVDIESTDIADVAARNAALVELSQQLRRLVGGRPLGAIVLPATLLEVINPKYWPGFPYMALAPTYDAWLPMVYWTLRLSSSGFRDSYRYTTDSVNRLRADLGPARRSPGTPRVAIDPIGGVSVDGVSDSDARGFVRAVADTGSSGGSLYEWPGSEPGGVAHAASPPFPARPPPLTHAARPPD